jgi:ribosomal protein S18 acetylase RimI-like enzyme
MSLTVDMLTRRPITPDDIPLLETIYASTRELEMAIVPWSEEEKAAFLHMQFEAQHRHYQTFFPDAQYLLLFDRDVPVGRIYIDRRGREMHVMDIALLPPFRNQGLGTALMREVMESAFASGQPVGLHVENFNPARRLYDRLGFLPVAEDGVYIRMLATAPEGGCASSTSTPPVDETSPSQD